MHMTLLQELGGREAVELVVAAFYERVLTDPLLRRYFRGVQMSRLYKSQADFFCAALGQPGAYQGRDLRSLHAGMSIGDTEFDAVAMHLTAALAECGVGQAHIERVIALIAPLRGDVVTRREQPRTSLRDDFYNQPMAAATCPVHATARRAQAWVWSLVALALILAALAGFIVWQGGPPSL
jgi:hemoglobin